MNELDRELLLWTNRELACPLMDGLMGLVSRDLAWYPVLAVVAVWAVARHGRRGAVTLLAMILAVAILDPVLGMVVKPMVGRLRPCHELGDLLRLAGPCRESWSFPSNHAANSAALVAALGLSLPRTLWLGIPTALVVGLSRIYLGVHYPTDVVVGLTVGALGGAGLCALLLRLTRRWTSLQKTQDQT